MRTDVKVGIAIAIILVVIGVVWCVWYRPSETPTKQAPGGSEVAGGSGGAEKTNVPEIDPPPSEELVHAPYHEPEPVWTPPSPTTRPADDTTVPSRLTSSTWPPAERTVPVEPGRIYVVKDGDSYWSIARSQWGDANLHPHLQEANPNIAPGALRPGMTIRIPPKPTATTVGPRRAGPAGGTTGVDPATGKRYYVVKKGDEGFWGVSKAVYGEGKHWKLVEAANPGLKARALQPGQKVWYPEKPATRVAVRPAHTGPAPVRPTTFPVVRGGTGAPVRAVLPDGRVFD